jgi:zinc protease
VIRERFGSWRGEGPAPAVPDYGRLAEPPTPAAVVTDPQAANSIAVEWVKPHDESPMTMARLQREFARDMAVGILGVRLGNEGDKGQAITFAGARTAENPHVVDEMVVGIRPRGSEWRPALDQAFGVVNGLLAAPPRQDEVDRQLDAMDRAFVKSVTDGETALSNSLANIFIADVDEGDVSAARSFYRDYFKRVRPTLTPAVAQATLRELFAPVPRMLLMSATPVGTTEAVTAFASARRVAAGAQAAERSVSLDEIKLPATPGKVFSTVRIDDLGIERVRFANGVELAMKQTAFDKDRIGVGVQIGHGVLNLDPSAPVPDWSAGALGLGGIGPFTREELMRLGAGRQIGVAVAYDKDGFGLASWTDRKDLADALRLSAAAATEMRYSPVALRRLKDQFDAGYQAIFSQPMGVYRAFASAALFSGDKRFAGLPDPGTVRALSDDAFAAFWQAQTAGGPIKLTVVGDFDRDALVDAVARTYGALPPHVDSRPTPQQLAVRPPAAGGSLLLHHRGDADQALVMRAFAVPGVVEDLPTTRALNVASEIITSLLTDRFREGEGGTYSPMVMSDQPDWLPAYGVLLAGAQVRPSRIADFEAALDRILTELATRGPDADQLARAKATLAARIQRARATNGFWIEVLGRNLDDARRVDAVRTQVAAYAAMDAATVQAAVARYLKPGASGSFEVKVLPEAKP